MKCIVSKMDESKKPAKLIDCENEAAINSRMCEMHKLKYPKAEKAK